MTGETTAAASAEPIFGKKFMSKLGGMANEEAASNVSAFARRQMEKMGWSEGKGLGKEEQGVVTHVRVKKREESMGIGVEKMQVEEQKNQWWYNAYDKIANKIQIAPDTDDETSGSSSKKAKKASKKAKKKAKKRAREAAANADGSVEGSVAKKFRIPTDEELFAATGGKLFGRRAYGSCNGKLKRDQLLQSGKFELKKRDAKDSTSTSSASSSSSGEGEGEGDDTAGETLSSGKNDKNDKKSKKDKKDKKKKTEQKKAVSSDSDSDSD